MVRTKIKKNQRETPKQLDYTVVVNEWRERDDDGLWSENLRHLP
jgi:hypothetical protein